MKLFLMFVISLFFLNINVSAASGCPYSEQSALNSKAANIKVKYETASEELTYEDAKTEIEYFKILILNVSEEFYVVIKNNNSEDIVATYTHEDANNGIIEYKWYDNEHVTTFNIQVFTSKKTNCSGEKYKTIYLTTPRYNEYYGTRICNENPEFYLCQKYVTFDKIDRDEFSKKIESFKNKNTNENGEEIKENEEERTILSSIFNFIDNNKWYILGGTLLIISIIFIVYRIKTKKQRDLGL